MRGAGRDRGEFPYSQTRSARERRVSIRPKSCSAVAARGYALRGAGADHWGARRKDRERGIAQPAAATARFAITPIR